jgi:NDP-sugar pyrophosphorylase family protein
MMFPVVRKQSEERTRMTNIVITMAGAGKRFRDAGYTCPKYCIEVHGKTLFSWAMLSLASFIKEDAAFTFICRSEDSAASFIETECRHLGIRRYTVLQLEEQTDGQATTALLAEPALEDPALPFLIYNIDTFVHPDAIDAAQVRGDGWIPCFPGKGDGWSFARTDASGKVLELREKLRISPHATIGLYWFSSFHLYKAAYQAYYSDASRMEKGEKYVAPLYNQIIGSSHDVFIHEVPFDAVIPLGIPQEVDDFRQRGEIPAGLESLAS